MHYALFLLSLHAKLAAMKRLSKSLKETHAIAADFVRSLVPSVHATVVALRGDLGSGKTSFTQGVAQALGVSMPITSPTFVIEKVYKLEGASFLHLIHVDAYRLAGGAELAHLGWHDLLLDPANLVLVEWPEIIADVMPADAHNITFLFIDETTREINLP